MASRRVWFNIQTESTEKDQVADVQVKFMNPGSGELKFSQYAQPLLGSAGEGGLGVYFHPTWPDGMLSITSRQSLPFKLTLTVRCSKRVRAGAVPAWARHDIHQLVALYARKSYAALEAHALEPAVMAMASGAQSHWTVNLSRTWASSDSGIQPTPTLLSPPHTHAASPPAWRD
jgi:hypothetical protein